MIVRQKQTPKFPRRVFRRELWAAIVITGVLLIVYFLANKPNPDAFTQLSSELNAQTNTLLRMDYDWLVIDAELGNIIGEI